MTFKLTGSETDGRVFVMEETVPRHTRLPGLQVRTREDQNWLVLEHVSRRST